MTLTALLKQHGTFTNVKKIALNLNELAKWICLEGSSFHLQKNRT